jgi:hypothetical protein
MLFPTRRDAVRLRNLEKLDAQRARLLEPEMEADLDGGVLRKLPADERTRKLARLLQRRSEWDAEPPRREKKRRQE